VSDNESIEPRNVINDVWAAVSELRDDYPETVFEIDGPDAAEALATPRLQLALRELGENAAKHGGQSQVRYRVEAPDDGHVTIQIQDSGPGLPECERDVLSGSRETPLNHGEGIGLWLVNWIVTGVGGSVTATVDDGTTVSIRLSTRESGRSGWISQQDAVFSTISE
jgi:signal transduction histidine kinase